MLTEHVRRFLPSCQQVPPLFIGLLAGLLSLDFTVTACGHMWPGQATLEIGALGLLCELGKLYFGPQALRGVMSGSLSARLSHLPLLGLSVALMACSIAASFGFTARTDAQGQASAVASSAAYTRAAADLQSYGDEIATLVKIQSGEASDNHRTKARETSDRIAALRQKKAALAAEVAGMQSDAHVATPTDAIFALLGARIGLDLSKTRTGLHLTCGILLELIAVAACLVYHAKSRPIVAPGRPQAPALAAINGGKCVPVHVSMAASGSLQTAPAAHCTDAVFSECTAAEMVGEAFVERYAAIKDGVLRGYIRPTLSAVRGAARVSQEPARRILEALSLEGVTREVGPRRYVRADAAA